MKKSNKKAKYVVEWYSNTKFPYHWGVEGRILFENYMTANERFRSFTHMVEDIINHYGGFYRIEDFKNWAKEDSGIYTAENTLVRIVYHNITDKQDYINDNLQIGVSIYDKKNDKQYNYTVRKYPVEAEE